MLHKIHHIAFAVYDLEKTIEDFKIYGLKPSKEIIIKDREMKAVLFKVGETWLEYLAPISEKSALFNFLQKKREGFHHIAYQVNKIKNITDTLPDGALLSSRKSDVGDWFIADINPEFTMGIKMQLIEEILGLGKVKEND
jgi:methylmalonyl-CoA/ethylmalonyl-CoA epimerase